VANQFIVKPERQPDVDAHIAAMWLLYASRPGYEKPDMDGSYFIGEVGETRMTEQKLLRDTPYSPCRGLRP
jgi:hypothetical protein